METVIVRSFVFFILFALCSVNAALAKSAPEWVTSFPKETSEYKFYVGRGSAKDETDAFDAATRNAYEQALKMNFGVAMQMNAETYQTETEARLTERFVEESALVRFNDFEQIDQFTEKKGGKITVWVLYRFSKDAIKAEKKRLAEIPKQAKKELSVVGSSRDSAKGTLEIETKPVDGADVYIDGERFGQTPLRLIGALKTGRHDLRLEHPLYDAVEETVIIVPGKTVKVSKTLKRAFADIDINTRPEQAEVRLNGRRIGLTPVKTKIPVGEKIKLSLRHPETEETVHYLSADKNDSKSFLFDLIIKPASLSIYSFPDGATAYVDGEKIGTTPVRDLQVDAGLVSVAIEKDGFEYERRSLNLKGGEKKSETFSLTPVKQSELVSFKPAAPKTDGHRDFQEILPRAKAVRLRRNASADDAVGALLRWNYPLSFLRVSLSRTNKIDEKTYRYFIRLSFDEKAYKRNFVTRASEILSQFAEEQKEDVLSESCKYETKTGNISCSLDKAAGHDNIFIKAGKTDIGFMFDTSPYKIFKVFTRSDWKNSRIANASAYKVRLRIFDKNGQESYVEDIPFRLRRFTLERNRNILFIPVLYREAAGGNGSQDLLLSTDLDFEAPPEETIGKITVKILTD